MQANYLDRIGEDKPATFVEVAEAIRRVCPKWWRVDEDYPDVISIYPEYQTNPDGPVFIVGTANETWAADFYPDRDAHESGRCLTGFDTDIEDEDTDADGTAKAIVEHVIYYLNRRPVRGEFLDALRDLRRAIYAVNSAWEKLDAEDSSSLVDEYPFQDSFDEMVPKVDAWITQARASLNDECQEHPADGDFSTEPKQASGR